MKARAFLLAAAWAGAAVPALGQTTDTLFRSWRLSEEVTAPRTLALAGAVAGLADDEPSSAINPAGLATIPRAGEFQIGWRIRHFEPLANGDHLVDRFKAVSPIGLAIRPAPWIGLSYHWVALRSTSRITLADRYATGTLKSSLNGPGIGIGVRVLPALTLGLNLNALQFHINDASYVQAGRPGARDLAVRLADKGDVRLTGALGVLVKTREVSYGFGLRWGRNWNGTRTATDPVTGLVIDGGSRFRVRTPWIASLGAAWQPDRPIFLAQGFLLTAQLDHVWLGAIRPTAVPGVPFPERDFEVPAGPLGSAVTEARVGCESTVNLWSLRLQLRGGFYHRPAGTLVYRGPDPAEQALFPDIDARNLVSIGAALGLNTIVQASAAWEHGLNTHVTTVVAGLSIRYPGLFP